MTMIFNNWVIKLFFIKSEGKRRKKFQRVAKLKISQNLRKNKLVTLAYRTQQTRVAKGKQKGQQKAQNNKDRLLHSFVLSTVPITAAALLRWILTQSKSWIVISRAKVISNSSVSQIIGGPRRVKVVKSGGRCELLSRKMSILLTVHFLFF